MSRKDSELKKSVLLKVKSLEKSIGMKTNKPIIVPQTNSPTFSKS